MKPEIKIEKKSLINCGNFNVSIGSYSTSDVAIISKSTGDFCHFKNIKKGSKLAKIKRKFKVNLCSDYAFFFSFMSEEKTLELIRILKSTR